MTRLERMQSDAEHARNGALDDGEQARAHLLATLPTIERRLTLAGLSTAVLEGGEGPPVVLLHGPGGYAAHWARIIPALATGHRVVAPDLPGHGATASGDRALDAERVLRWLDELIDQTCAAPPALVGELIGGAIAARFAIDRPERLSRLILVDTFGLDPLQPAPEFSLALTRFQSEPDPTTHESLWRVCARDLPTLRAGMGELWEPFEAYNLDRARVPELKAAQQRLMAEFAFRAIPGHELARLALPTTLIWGRHDLATPLAVAERASADYGWPLVVIENANDAPPIEQPEAFSRALERALGGADDGGRS